MSFAEIPPIPPEYASNVSNIWNMTLKGILDKPIEFEIVPRGFFELEHVPKDGLLGAFETKDGISASIIMIRELARGAASSGKIEVFHLYPWIFFLTSIPKPIPTTIFAKRIGGIFRADRVFIPYDMKILSAVGNAKTIFEKKIGWYPLVETLNNDKTLRKKVSSLPTHFSPSINWEYKPLHFFLSDTKTSLRTVTQLVPIGDETEIVVRFVDENPESPDQINRVMEIFRRIHRHIDEYDFKKSTISTTPDPYPLVLRLALRKIQNRM